MRLEVHSKRELLDALTVAYYQDTAVKIRLHRKSGKSYFRFIAKSYRIDYAKHDPIKKIIGKIDRLPESDLLK